MSKIFLALAILIAMANSGLAIEQREVISSDIIVQVYNDSCIETANWQYLQINNAEDLTSGFGHLSIGNWQGINILVHEVRIIGPKTVLADIIPA
jgi:hypothetical protein